MIENFHVKDFSQGKPSTLVFILHGYGADAANLLNLADYFADYIQNPVFIVPDAPFPFEYGPNIGRQWFALSDRSEDKLVDGANVAYKILLNFIDTQLAKYNLTYNNIIFIGFSQGAMMSLYTGLKLPQNVKGIVGFSGTVVSVDETLATYKSKPKICLIHGIDDDIVPHALGKFSAKILKNNNFDVTFHEIDNLMHSIDANGIRYAQNFLKNIDKNSE